MSRYPTKGPGDLPGDSRHPNSPDCAPSADEAIDALVANWLNDPAKCREADEYRNGCLDDEVYSQTHFALADLGALDWDAIAAGNWPAHVHAVLHRVHSIALRYFDARKDELTERAVAYTDRQRKEADEAETEISMMLAEVAP